MQKIIFLGAVVILAGVQSSFGAVRHDLGCISPDYSYRASEETWKATDLYQACENGNSAEIDTIIQRLKESGTKLSEFDLGRYFAFVVHSDPLPGRFEVAECLLRHAAHPLYGMSADRRLKKRFEGVDICSLKYPHLSRIVSEVREMKK